MTSCPTCHIDAKRFHLVTLEVVEKLKSAHFLSHRSWLPSAVNVVRDMVVNVVRGRVVDVVEDVAITEAAGGFLKTFAELISMLSQEL
jgi:hypothetical protein